MSYISGRLGRLLAGASTIVALSATLTLAPSATAGVEADGPHYQEPAVGQCRNYTLDAGQKMSNSSPVVECSLNHTAMTVAVVQLPDTLNWSSSVDELQTVVDNKCTPKWRATVGGTLLQRVRANFTQFWFAPTQFQKDHGARWIRCDVALVGHQALIPLPKTAAPWIRDGKIPYAVTKCVYGTSNYYTACIKSHHHRATGAFALADGAYPGDAAVTRAAARRCPNLTSGSGWLYTHPTRESWKYGDRIIVCFTKTTH